MRFFVPVYDVDVFMKSGNVVRLKNVSQFDVKYNGSEVTNLEWTHTSKQYG